MEFFKLALIVALTLCSVVPVTAQFSNARGSTTNDLPEAYSIFSVGYDYNSVSVNSKYDLDDIDKNALSTNGIALQYTHGESIMPTAPIYLEWGIRASLGFKSVTYYEDEEDYWDDDPYEYKITTLYLSMPVNVAYHYAINETVAVIPYTGLHLKGNILGKLKWDDGDDDSVNFYDKEHMGHMAWKRIQFGWQIGSRVSFKSFNVGLEYGLDFNELFYRAKTSNYMLTVCFNI